jgi:uncharacterized protein YggU (UPF0235/DUF167 family)
MPMADPMNAADEKPYAPDGDGVRLAIRLTPRAGRNGVDGVVRGSNGRPALRLRLAAAPIEGAANDALIGFLSDALGLRKSAIRIRSGATARLKILHLSGDAADIAARLDAWIGAAAR